MMIPVGVVTDFVFVIVIVAPSSITETSEIFSSLVLSIEETVPVAALLVVYFTL